MIRILLALALTASVGACSTLPRDGPSNRAIMGAASADADASFALIDLDYAVSERIKQAAPPALGSLAGAGSNAPTDLIQVGDTLDVAIFEPGGALFGGSSASKGAPGTATQSLPALVVNRDGTVTIPFAGSVRVAGLTPRQAEQAIHRALVGKVVSPQVVVAVPQSPSNGVTVLGSVKAPGRVPISANSNTILDVVAAAGGADGPPENILVTITRGDRTVSAPLVSVYRDAGENIRLSRGDQVNLISRPRRFSSFGALGKINLTDMPTGDLTLTGALSSLGGLDPNAANARSVLVFRFERPEVARALGVTLPETRKGVPLIYRLNLAEPAGFFTANNFVVQAEDVVYVPRADSAELRKFFEFVQTVTRVIYDVTVTGTLGIN